VTVAPQTGAKTQRPSHTWAWALGTILAVFLVVAGAYAGHRYVARTSLAAAHVPPPANPPVAVLAVLRPEAGAAYAVSTGVPRRLLLLAGPRESECTPAGSCEPAPALDTLLIVDADSGGVIAQTPLSGTARLPIAVATDPGRGLADVVSASAVDVFSASTGVRIGGSLLPAGVIVGSSTGAVVTSDGALLLTARRADTPVLLGLDPGTGALRFSAAVAGATSLDGPLYDRASGLAVVLAREADGSTLMLAYASADGTPLGALGVPLGTRLGPLDTASRALYLFEADGTTARLPISALTDILSHPGLHPNAPFAPAPSLYGAQALGWNTALGHTYVADHTGLRILDTASGRTLAALPLPVVAAPNVPLMNEDATGAIYLPTDHGAVAVVHDGTDSLAHTLTADTAAILARAAVAQLAPRGLQTPPFVTPATFTIGPGSRTLSYWARDPELGSNGPYPGHAVLDVKPAASGGGGYDVTFTVTWNERFERKRMWVYRVAADGGVRLTSDQGDGLP
jgi:hypothetical protein